jgi:hypothetical protein
MNNLKTIKKIIFNGAASKINGIFSGTTALENIVWEGNIEVDTNFTAF